MLVIRRRVRETVVINGNVVVTVIEAKGGRTVLAVDAPRDVPVVRGEADRREQREGDHDA